MNMRGFWFRVKLRMKEKGFTQEEIARAINVNYSTFRNWMSRKMVIPLNYAYNLSQYLGLSLEYLIAGHGDDKVSKTNEKVIMLLKEAEGRLSEIRRDVIGS